MGIFSFVYKQFRRLCHSLHTFTASEAGEIGTALKAVYRTFLAFAIVAVMLFISLILIYSYADVETTMLEVQKIFYLHVPAAMTVYLAFGVNFIFSIKYLIKRKSDDDLLAASAAEIGLVFCTIVLLSGPIWARYAWHTWWTWEARLTSTLVLWLMYIGYFILRNALPAENRRTFSAVLGIIAFIDVPIVHYATKFWETKLHPERGAKMNVLPTIQNTLMIVLLTFIILFTVLLILQYKTKKTELRYEAIRRKHLQEFS